MKVIEDVAGMSECSRQARASGLRVGLVPTMGALHAGHMSLVQSSVRGTDFTVASIFVNPTQFEPGEDLQGYPRDIEADCEKLEKAGVDALFLPNPEMMYPDGYATYVMQEGLGDALCGADRPTHFRGVLTIVLKLFNIVRPHSAYFGAKDYQQSVLIRQMAKDMVLDIDISVLPTVREEDGLAMSSRNRYLSSDERKDALCLYRALLKGEKRIAGGERSARAITSAMKIVVGKVNSARLDYLSVVDPDSLRTVDDITGTVVLAGAVRLGGTRLIDNLTVEPGE